MTKLMKSPYALAFGGVTIAVILLLAGLLFLSPEPCPRGFTTEQPACSTGANLGLGLVVLLAIAIAASGFIAAAVARRSN